MVEWPATVWEALKAAFVFLGGISTIAIGFFSWQLYRLERNRDQAVFVVENHRVHHQHAIDRGTGGVIQGSPYLVICVANLGGRASGVKGLTFHHKKARRKNRGYRLERIPDVYLERIDAVEDRNGGNHLVPSGHRAFLRLEIPEEVENGDTLVAKVEPILGRGKVYEFTDRRGIQTRFDAEGGFEVPPPATASKPED